MKLKDLAQDLIDSRLIGDGNIKIESLFTDSREKVRNGLFFCLVGENVDSHTLVKQARENGAIALVTERELAVEIPQILVEDTRLALGVMASVFYGEPSKQMKIIGITGTNGKTTISYMLFSILEKAQKKVGVIGTLGVYYNGEKRSSALTTPDPLCLQKTLADMYKSGVEYVVMEVSAHALHYKKVAGIAFAACIFTNLTQDHLDFFHTMQAYKEAKYTLFYPENCPIAILNGDDKVGREIALFRGEERTVFYGLKTPTDCFAVITDEGLYGTECMLNISDKLCRVSLSLVGEHNVYNALAAASCAVELEIDCDAVSKGLTELRKVEGRLEWINRHNGADIYVDFAHTPDGLEKSLDTLKKHCKASVVCLFGCGGNRDKEKRALMGEIAGKKCDFCVLTSDNPRYEDPLDILSEIERGYRRFSVKYVIVPDRKKGIEYAISFLKKGDVLLIAGKGAEEYQEIMGIKYPFKDHHIVEKILNKKG